MAIESSVLAVLVWLAVVKLIQLALWPAIAPCFSRYAYPISFSASVLGLSLVAWYLGLAGLPVQLALLPFLVLLGWNAYRRAYTRESLVEHWRWDAVFIILFVFLLSCRYITPQASYAEKFMDHAFLASIMRTPIVPPLDPWFAGGRLNVYYYYGSWIVGVLGIVSTIASRIVFNLGLPTIFALAGVNLYMVGDLLLSRYRWAPLAMLFLPNPASVGLFLAGHPLSKVAWDSTRVITNTINEYPLFSFIWGDLHAHVIGIFNQTFLIALLVFALVRWAELGERARLVLVGLVALSLGAMPGINTWDVLVYGPLTVLVGAILWYRSRDEVGPRIRAVHLLVGGPALAIALYTPYYLSFASAGFRGVGIVSEPSDPVQFLMVHGFLLGLVLVLCLRDLWHHPWLIAVAVPFMLGGYTAAAIAAVPLAVLVRRLVVSRIERPEELLAALGIGLALLCEFIYLRDNMGDQYYRMNSVFKFYLISWILLGIGTFTMAARAADRPSVTDRLASVPPTVRKATAVVAIALVLIAPFAAAGSFTSPTYTLDALAFLDREHPDDAQAIRFLQGLEGEHVIIEAKGDDFSYAARVSAMTGIPAVIGWTFHEYLWRNDYGPITERTNDVRDAYEDPAATHMVMEKYGADLIYVGDLERQTYQISLPTSGIEPIYDQRGVQIYRRTEA